MYDFYEVKYGELYGCFYCKPWNWQAIKLAQGVRIILGANVPPESRKKDLEEFLIKKGAKCVVWK